VSEDSKFDDVTPGGLAAAAAASVAGAAAGLAVPVAGGVAAVGVQALVNFVGRGHERRQQKALMMVDVATSAGDTTAEELLDRADSDDGRIELTMRALAAAARATSDAKIRAIGRALATGVLAADDAIVQHEIYVIDALDRLEAPHVKVLDILSATRVPQVSGQLYKTVELAWPVPAIASKYPQAGAALPSLLATLVSIGAITDVALGAADYRATYETNDFGKLLLERLREAGS
jgi:hypothetical protein